MKNNRIILLAMLLGVTEPAFLKQPATAAEPTSATAKAVTESAPAIFDQLSCGEATSLAAHGRRTTGDVRSEQLATEIGGFARTYGVQTVTGRGSALSFTLQKPKHAKDLILEVQEIHVRRPKAFGYTVAVNGTDVYFRTYEEIGAGPNHYFIRIPAAVAQAGKDLNDLKVTMTSAGAPAFSVGQVWLYHDFFGTIEPQEQVYRPVALLGMVATAPGVGGPGRDFAPYGEYRDVNFLNVPFKDIRQRLRDQLVRSAETGRPVEILLNGTTWGGAPRGPDGQGGYFTDIRYSQMAFDVPSKSWSPAYPNMWGSTFWTSSWDPLLQTIMRQRFLAGTAEISETVDLLKARGQTPRPLYTRELGPPLGEVNAATMAAAAKDGVTLDPTDGLDQAERAWLHTNDVRLWKLFASWHAEVFPRESVVVDRGTVRLPDEQAIDNQYAHTVFTTDQGPLKDRRYFGGQAGMVDGFWSSGEVFFDRFAQYDYVKANGKLAHVNIWAPFAKTPDLMRNLYDAGFQYATFIGDTAETTKVIRAADGCAALPALIPPHYLPSMLEVMYNTQRTMGPSERIVSSDNLTIHSQSRECADSGSMSRLAVVDLAKPGSITYRLDNGGEPFESGLSLQLDGRIAPGAGNSIQVLLGETPESLGEVAKLNAEKLPCPDHWEPYMTSKTTVDLGERLKGKKSGVLRLVMHAQGAFDATFLMELKVAGQWRRGSGHLVANPFTMYEQRTLNLWVQERVVAERLFARYRALAGEDDIAKQAAALLAAGRYGSVERLLNGAVSEVLPARYALRGHGRLGRQALEIALPDENQVIIATVHELNAEACEFTVTPESGRQKFVAALPAKDGSHWTQTEVAPNRFRLVADAQGALIAKAGRITIEAESVRAAPPARTLPKTIVARYLDGNRANVRIDSQDTQLLGGEENLSLPVATDVTVERIADHEEKPRAKSDWPQRGDRLELLLNERGQVAKISARYGYDHGRIAKVTPFSALPPFSNGTLVLDDGRTYEFDYATEVDTVALHGLARSYEAHMLTSALPPGAEVTIDYSPYTEAGTTRRLLGITQRQQVLMTQDYTTMTGDDWRAAAQSADGVVVKRHNPEPHNGDNHSFLMRPAQPFEPGTVVYKVTSERPLGMTVLEFSARVYDDSSLIDFAASKDGGATWVACGRFDNTWQNCYAQSVRPWKVPWNFIDLTPVASGRTDLLVKLTMRVNPADERMALGRIRVMTTTPAIEK
jgi:hypothetical protein